MAFTQRDEFILDYLFRSILRDIAFMELFNIDDEMNKTFKEWKINYGKEVKSINLLDLVQHVGKMFNIIEKFKSNFVNHYYHKHFLYDIEYFRLFLEKKGSKTGDMNSVMLRSCNNKSYITNIPKNTYYMNILISLCYIISHNIPLIYISMHNKIIDIIENLKKSTKIGEQIDKIKNIPNEIEEIKFPPIISDAINHITCFCIEMIKEEKNVLKSCKSNNIDSLSESYKIHNTSHDKSNLKSEYPKSYLFFEGD